MIERIKKYIDYKGINISKFEKSIGMSNATFSKSLRNNGAIGTDKLEKILKIYEDLNPEWVVTGKGSMIKESDHKIDIVNEPSISYNGKSQINGLIDALEMIRDLSAENALLKNEIRQLKRGDLSDAEGVGVAAAG